jgi:predicted RNase H-like HicB family nuclease
MPKHAGSKRRHDETWTGFDHAIRAARKAKSDGEETSYRERRLAALNRDSKAQHESHKLRLHIVKTERELDRLRERLSAWDDVVEEEREKNRLENERKSHEQQDEHRTKKGKKGPESWKLRGAARPAWEVYDFDTRYVDPYLKEQEEAHNKAKRARNILMLYKGRLGEESDNGPPQPQSRNFLALLIQMGHLCLQAKKFKAARAAFIECMDLDGAEHPITTARCHLMRLYLEANRPESARRLWERLPNDKSVWIRYSAALVEYVSWKLLKEKGSTRESAEALLAQAIQANVFCAYYLAYFETFESVMEYTEDIEDAHEQTLEEAIEYCCSEQHGAWLGTDGAIEWLQRFILHALNGRPVAGGALRSSDMEWQDRLVQLEIEYETRKSDGNSDEPRSDDDDDDSRSDEDEPDTKMFAGMFRTGLEMLQDRGDFAIEVPDSDVAEDPSD